MFHISNCTNTPVQDPDQATNQTPDQAPDQAQVQTLSEEPIHVCTLDSMKIQNVGFIKLDVEYNELAVLQGGKLTIHQNLPKILFEINPEGDTTRDKQDIFDYLTKEFNYKITAITGTNNMYLAYM